MEDLEYESKDGISIGTAVTLPDGRFVQFLTTDEDTVLGILVSDLSVGYQR